MEVGLRLDEVIRKHGLHSARLGPRRLDSLLLNLAQQLRNRSPSVPDYFF